MSSEPVRLSAFDLVGALVSAFEHSATVDLRRHLPRLMLGPTTPDTVRTELGQTAAREGLLMLLTWVADYVRAARAGQAQMVMRRADDLGPALTALVRLATLAPSPRPEP
jgi:hypothetical protein